MESFSQLNTNKKTLDLREWWIQIEKEDVEHIVNNKGEWSYWRFSENKERITTLKAWKVNNYKINETEILLNKNKEKAPTIKTIKIVKKEKQSELLTDLLLSPNCQVRDTLDAYEKAKYSDKTKFWFISKWEDKFVIVLDFSEWKRPKISRYSLNKYKIKLKTVEV